MRTKNFFASDNNNLKSIIPHTDTMCVHTEYYGTNP